jgi:hypothetical protein
MEENTDVMQFISMIFGIISFIVKIKWGIWLSLIFFLSSYVNLRNNVEQKNFIMNFSLIMMGFFMIYLSPQPRYQQQIPPDATTIPPKK